MDNLTHSLTGLMLSRAGLNRFDRRASLILILSANAPDVDVVSLLGGPLSYLEYHRGLTHSLAFLPVLAAITVAVVSLFSRSWAGWRAAYVLALIGVASHLLLDWTNSYAIRLLLPFSGEWFHLDWMFVLDPLIWAVLLLAVFGPLLGRLVSSEIGAKPGSGRGLAIFALLCFAAVCFGRSLLHDRALATLNARIYNGAAPTRVAAFSLMNPLRWTGWVEGSNFATRFDLNLTGDFDPASGRTFYKPEPSPALDAARQTLVFQKFLQFSIYPVWSVSPAPDPEGASLVEVWDERFSFGASAIVDRGNRVVRSWVHL
ncbi:MAG: metal-dependent hydrolase [Bryobacteraceae bacterium]